MSDTKRQVAFRMPDALISLVQAWARHNGESPSWAARDLLRRGLLSIPPEAVAPTPAPEPRRKRPGGKRAGAHVVRAITRSKK